MLAYAVISMCLALTFYSIGVWGERLQGILKKWHLYVFWTGLFFDTAGTAAMSMLSREGFQLNFHGITGLAAIILMSFHAIWAALVLARRDETMKIKFHRFSMIVWLIWLIPFVSGALSAMT